MNNPISVGKINIKLFRLKKCHLIGIPNNIVSENSQRSNNKK